MVTPPPSGPALDSNPVGPASPNSSSAPNPTAPPQGSGVAPVAPAVSLADPPAAPVVPPTSATTPTVVDYQALFAGFASVLAESQAPLLAELRDGFAQLAAAPRPRADDDEHDGASPHQGPFVPLYLDENPFPAPIRAAAAPETFVVPQKYRLPVTDEIGELLKKDKNYAAAAHEYGVAIPVLFYLTNAIRHFKETLLDPDDLDSDARAILNTLEGASGILAERVSYISLRVDPEAEPSAVTYIKRLIDTRQSGRIYIPDKGVEKAYRRFLTKQTQAVLKVEAARRDPSAASTSGGRGGVDSTSTYAKKVSFAPPSSGGANRGGQKDAKKG